MTATTNLLFVKPFDQQAAKATKSHKRNSSLNKELSRSQDRLHETLYPLLCKPSKAFKKTTKKLFFPQQLD
jgi:hypothetical protein